MNKEMQDLSYEWWVKLTPLWKKFARETYLCGYDKEDLVQECYLQLINALEKFDEALGVPFESYYKIQLYGWRANQNRKKRECLSLSEEDYQQLSEKPDGELSVEEQVENQLLFEAVQRELTEMKSIDESIITKYYIESKPLKEIAKELNIKYKSAEFRKGKMIKQLREKLHSNIKASGLF
ncbi:MAG: sigma-70 family polymerase sigma factor [Clostridia bacterium]|jgi:RNA polymerase sigma factor (sigma-70 family)|nr:sigma-70 family polymerase sigma factor [Clostridia bacterium]